MRLLGALAALLFGTTAALAQPANNEAVSQMTAGSVLQNNQGMVSQMSAGAVIRQECMQPDAECLAKLLQHVIVGAPQTALSNSKIITNIVTNTANLANAKLIVNVVVVPGVATAGTGIVPTSPLTHFR